MERNGFLLHICANCRKNKVFNFLFGKKLAENKSQIIFFGHEHYFIRNYLTFCDNISPQYVLSEIDLTLCDDISLEKHLDKFTKRSVTK